MTRPAANARIDALEAEVARLRQAFEERDRAPDGDLVSTTIAGRLIGKSPETLRRWCLAHGIGVFSPAGAVFLVSKKRLAEYLLRTTGAVPEALR
jgi:hypothetical protein